MKNILYLLLAISVLIMACNAEADQKKDTANAETAAQETKPAKPATANQPTASAGDQSKIDQDLIDKYIADNKLDAKKTASGLYYIVDKEGTDEIPRTATVKVHYEGTLLDGTKFDSSYDRGQPTSFPLNRVIPGWTEGIPLFKKGGSGRLIIPSRLAYGPRAVGGKIPPNSVLTFKVEVLDVKEPKAHNHSHDHGHKHDHSDPNHKH